jgi:Na+-transporting methylmalonyl-CoA/oxaloacetate decarboxylase gamma subunit
MLDLLFVASLVLLVGMTIVILSLLLFAGVIVALRTSDERFNLFRIRRYSARVEAKPEELDVNDELVAVLTAAATVAIRKSVRIRRMRFLDARAAGAWTSTGRLNIMASHAVPKRKSSS